MKYSKTALKELTARYRDVLRKCAFLNAIILMGAALSTPAMADTVEAKVGDVEYATLKEAIVSDAARNGTPGPSAISSPTSVTAGMC